MPPTIRYATTSDAVRVAYASLGEGIPILCVPPLPFSHLEAGWSVAGQRVFYERLARGAQVALYDARGTGLSDRDRAEFSLAEAMTRDLEGVARRLGWGRFALLGMFNGVPVAIDYAARHPETVSDLIVWGAFARGTDVYPVALPAEASELAGLYWSMAADTAAQTWTAGADDSKEIAAFFRQCVEPQAAIRAFIAAREYDVSALLPQVRARTLVLHRPHARGQRPDLAPDLAAAIPDAELALLDGDAPSPFAGDVDAAVEAIERFLHIEQSVVRTPGHAAIAELTPREAEVLRLLARGLANKEIAQALDLSVHTVERHLTNLYPKIGCRSRTEAAAFALTHGHA